MSHSPGIKNLPVAATTSAFFGTLPIWYFSIRVTLSPSTTTIMFGFAGEPVASMTVTSVTTSDFGPTGRLQATSVSVAKVTKARTFTILVRLHLLLALDNLTVSRMVESLAMLIKPTKICPMQTTELSTEFPLTECTKKLYVN